MRRPVPAYLLRTGIIAPWLAGGPPGGGAVRFRAGAAERPEPHLPHRPGHRRGRLLPIRSRGDGRGDAVLRGRRGGRPADAGRIWPSALPPQPRGRRLPGQLPHRRHQRLLRLRRARRVHAADEPALRRRRAAPGCARRPRPLGRAALTSLLLSAARYPLSRERERENGSQRPAVDAFPRAARCVRRAPSIGRRERSFDPRRPEARGRRAGGGARPRRHADRARHRFHGGAFRRRPGRAGARRPRRRRRSDLGGDAPPGGRRGHSAHHARRDPRARPHDRRRRRDRRRAAPHQGRRRRPPAREDRRRRQPAHDRHRRRLEAGRAARPLPAAGRGGVLRARRHPPRRRSRLRAERMSRPRRASGAAPTATPSGPTAATPSSTRRSARFPSPRRSPRPWRRSPASSSTGCSSALPRGAILATEAGLDELGTV